MESMPLVFWTVVLHVSGVQQHMKRQQCSGCHRHRFTLLVVSVCHIAGALSHTEQQTQCQQENGSTNSQQQLEIVTILGKDKDVLNVVAQWLTYLHQSAQTNHGAWTKLWWLTSEPTGNLRSFLYVFHFQLLFLGWISKCVLLNPCCCWILHRLPTAKPALILCDDV